MRLVPALHLEAGHGARSVERRKEVARVAAGDQRAAFEPLVGEVEAVALDGAAVALGPVPREHAGEGPHEQPDRHHDRSHDDPAALAQSESPRTGGGD
ncbi:MAG: hypothetical protein ACK56F_04155, partial [bacterium]